MALSVKMLKRGKRLTPYVSYSHVNGLVQAAFRNVVGEPAGKCVIGKVRAGMAQSDIRQAVADCGRAQRGANVRGEMERIRQERAAAKARRTS